MKKYLVFILLFCCGTTAIGQDINIRMAFDTSRIFIGDQINFTITVEQPAEEQLKFPAFKDTLTGNIEILNGPDVDSVAVGENRIRVTEKYLVTSFDSGYYEIDPVYVEVKNIDGIKRVYSDYAMLEVMKYKIAPSDTTARIYDIIEPYRAPVTIREIIPWALLSLVAAGVIAALIVLARKRRMIKEGVEEVRIPDPAHEIAFRELKRLKAEQLWQNGHFKQYYTRLAGILRQYLENRYGVYSLELTTSETLRELLKTGFKKDEGYNRLKTVLTAADLVKFAKYVPMPEENENHFIESWAFVDATKSIPVIEQPESGGVKMEGSV
jgi:hypothetical protein